MATVIEFLVEVDVAKGSTGPHEEGAVTFKYTGLNQTGKEVLLDRDGNLNLRGTGADVSLRFVLANNSLTWGGQSWDVKFPTHAADALWIFENQLDKSKYKGNDQEFKDFNYTQYSNRQTVTVEGNNKRHFIYDYAIAVVVTSGGRSYTHRHDPQIKNGGLTFNFTWAFQQAVMPVLLAIVALLLVTDIVIRMWPS